MALSTILPKLLQYKVNVNKAAAVGIIGGADGPTAIFISTGYNKIATLISGLLSVVGIFYLLITKNKGNQNQ